MERERIKKTRVLFISLANKAIWGLKNRDFNLLKTSRVPVDFSACLF